VRANRKGLCRSFCCRSFHPADSHLGQTVSGVSWSTAFGLASIRSEFANANGIHARMLVGHEKILTRNGRHTRLRCVVLYGVINVLMLNTPGWGPSVAVALSEATVILAAAYDRPEDVYA